MYSVPINDFVYKINEQLLNEIPEKIKNYKSIDNLANREPYSITRRHF